MKSGPAALEETRFCEWSIAREERVPRAGTRDSAAGGSSLSAKSYIARLG